MRAAAAMPPKPVSPRLPLLTYRGIVECIYYIVLNANATRGEPFKVELRSLLYVLLACSTVLLPNHEIDSLPQWFPNRSGQTMLGRQNVFQQHRYFA